MRRPILVALCLAGTAALTACDKSPDAEMEAAMKDINVIDESNLSDIMLTVGDPDEAVNYFQRTAEQNPDRIDIHRNLARSMVRAGRTSEAVQVWTRVTTMQGATDDDRIGLADALIRTNDWTRAEAELARIPPTHETFDRYRLEAMVADSKKQWKKADSFYEIASGLTTKPAGVLNNWGFSKLSRGDAAGAEKLFMQALTYDPNRFTTKNNLAMARAAQRKYDLPVIKMSQAERAELLYTLGLTAVKQGDVTTGRQLLAEAVETHPQHFEAAARSLAALEG
jgi:Tfp pilus assembly protein PilF